MKVLHITNWFPSSHFPNEAIWVQRLIESIQDSVDQRVYHVEIFQGSLKFEFKKHQNRTSYLVWLPWQIWRLNEIIYALVLGYILLIKEKTSNYSVINFHIAYPMLTYFHVIKKLLKVPAVISEHWSAYHFNFHIQRNDKMTRIRRIFHHRLPVITVSKSLAHDIQLFADRDFPNFIVPNIVDQKIFDGQKRNVNLKKPYFFMVSQWKNPKRPELALQAFHELKKNNIELLIGGYGPLLSSMSIEARKNPRIKFLGPLSSSEIANYLSGAIAFIHPTDYETFSVVCAEALYCACPVIASDVGGIKEYVNAQNGRLVRNSISSFADAMESFQLNPIHVKDVPDFSNERVRKLYLKALFEVENEFER